MKIFSENKINIFLFTFLFPIFGPWLLSAQQTKSVAAPLNYPFQLARASALAGRNPTAGPPYSPLLLRGLRQAAAQLTPPLRPASPAASPLGAHLSPTISGHGHHGFLACAPGILGVRAYLRRSTWPPACPSRDAEPRTPLPPSPLRTAVAA
jgi:hypothetical protein